MFPFLGSLLGTVGSLVNGFFGFKQAQGDTVKEAISAIGAASAAETQYAQAAATAITGLYENGPPVERLWRPIFMWIILGMLVARWFFGITPPFLTELELEKLYMFLEIGLIGYIPLRSIDKWMKGFQIGSILKAFIEKKLG